MAEFIVDFQLFMSSILVAIGDFFGWFSQTIIGEVILFILIFYIFLFILKLIISLKD